MRKDDLPGPSLQAQGPEAGTATVTYHAMHNSFFRLFVIKPQPIFLKTLHTGISPAEALTVTSPHAMPGRAAADAHAAVCKGRICQPRRAIA